MRLHALCILCEAATSVLTCLAHPMSPSSAHFSLLLCWDAYRSGHAVSLSKGRSDGRVGDESEEHQGQFYKLIHTVLYHSALLIASTTIQLFPIL